MRSYSVVSHKYIKKSRTGYLIRDLTNFILEKKVLLNQYEFCKLHVGRNTIARPCSNLLFVVS